MIKISKIEPIHGHVLLVPDKEDYFTHFGIALPGRIQMVPAIGKVYATMEGSGLEMDDVVAFPKGVGREIEHQGQKLMAVQEKEIFAVV